MPAPWEITVDRALCIGSGVCASTAPETFVVDGHQARVRKPLIPPGEAVVDAAGVCPVEAISIRDTSTGRHIFPPE